MAFDQGTTPERESCSLGPCGGAPSVLLKIHHIWRFLCDLESRPSENREERELFVVTMAETLLTAMRRRVHVFLII